MWVSIHQNCLRKITLTNDVIITMLRPQILVSQFVTKTSNDRDLARRWQISMFEKKAFR